MGLEQRLGRFIEILGGVDSRFTSLCDPHKSCSCGGSGGYAESVRMKTYSEKLKDPRWQRKRLEILHRDDFTCQSCQDSKSEVHVHHRRYVKNKSPWEYDNGDYITLCKTCHDLITNLVTFIQYWGHEPAFRKAVSSAAVIMRDEKLYYPFLRIVDELCEHSIRKQHENSNVDSADVGGSETSRREDGAARP